MSEKQIRMRKALLALYLEVPEKVASEIDASVTEAVAELEAEIKILAWAGRSETKIAKRLLRLCQEEKQQDGWSLVSAAVLPMLRTQLPAELIEVEKLNDGTDRGRVRLTKVGEIVLGWS